MDVAPLDITRPSPAGVYDALAGGKNNFAADREAAAALEALNPDARACVADNRAFIARAADWAAAERGVRQFLDLGAGFPRPGMPHEAAEGARAVYVDSDPRVADHLAHRAEVASWGPGVAVVKADLRDIGTILTAARGTGMGLDEPVCLLAGLVLHFMPACEAAKVVDGYVSLLAPGSVVAVSCWSTNDDVLAEKITDAYPGQLYRHSRADIEAILGGLELVPPGITTARGWRPDWGYEKTRHRPACILAGVGLKG